MLLLLLQLKLVPSSTEALFIDEGHGDIVQVYLMGISTTLATLTLVDLYVLVDLLAHFYGHKDNIN